MAPLIFLTQPSKFSYQNTPQATPLGLLPPCVPVPSAPSCQDPPPLRGRPSGVSADCKFFQDLRPYKCHGALRSLAVVFPTQLLPWALGSKEVQSLGQKGHEPSLIYSFWTTLHLTSPSSAPYGWWESSHHLLGGRQSKSLGRQVQ